MNNSVKKAFQIIEYVAERQGKVRQIDLIKEFDMNKATAHRYFDMLEEMGMLEKRDKQYYLGLGLLRLGNKVQSKNIIINRISPSLERIVSEINETVNLARYNGKNIVYLYRVESNRSLQFKASPGDNLPAHCTALGKATLSLLTDEEILKIVEQEGLPKFTKNTITSHKKLIEQINKIRNDGYAIENEEYEAGLICASFPLYIPEAEFTGAISFSGSTNRLNEDKIKQMVKKIMPFIERIKRDFNKTTE